MVDNRKGEEFLRVIQDNFLKQVILESSQENNILDLILRDREEEVTQVEVGGQLGNINEVKLQSQPVVSDNQLQIIAGQGRTSDQTKEGFYYEILPDLSSRRVIVSRPAQDTEEPVYSDVLPEHDLRPRSPPYENVPVPPGGAASPQSSLEASEANVSNIYATVTHATCTG
ncbi:hypothetical protein E2C01_043691 [Portunus trituberculatus]|uniref:Uncharacterized protein n=1 Tax=Portunus trituberculatus TaxID=210409 RepID=A0A5B7FWC9_PORTR|nr:hypothetical protein [Portunus trituberculatus]